MSPTALPSQTHIGTVHLQVADLPRALAFYVDLLGLRVIAAAGGEAHLSATGTEPALLRLTSRSGATPRPRGVTGLFHVAWRAPDRRELGRWLRRLLEARVPLHGASDHGVSEALYLPDPDGLGVELYCDRPRALWPRRGPHVAMVSERLDTADLLAAADGTGPWDGAHAATDIGHVHLCVSSLKAAEAFYVEGLGFEVMQRDYPGALFLAAGGYHHHLGANTWQSGGGPPPPETAVGLLSFTVVVPEAADVGVVRERLDVVGDGPEVVVPADGTTVIVRARSAA